MEVTSSDPQPADPPAPPADPPAPHADPPAGRTTEPPAGGTAHRPSMLELAAASLLAGSVVLHIVAIFPDYFAGNAPASIASQTDQAALYAVVAAVWALALGLGISGPTRVPAAAALAAGAAAGELGYRLADLGQVFRYGSSQAGTGLWVMTAAWVVGAAGAVTAAIAVRRSVRAPADPTKLVSGRAVPITVVTLLSIAAAGLYLPAWDHYNAVSSVTGRTLSFNLGNAFSQPWQIIVGNMVAAVAIVAVSVLGVRHMWRRRTAGAAAIAGVLGMLSAQFVAAVVGVDQAVSPAVAGVSGAEARQLGLAFSLKLTGWFALDVLAAFALFVAAIATATAAPDPADPATATATATASATANAATTATGFQANSGATFPSAPDARSDSTSAWP